MRLLLTSNMLQVERMHDGGQRDAPWQVGHNAMSLQTHVCLLFLQAKSEAQHRAVGQTPCCSHTALNAYYNVHACL